MFAFDAATAVHPGPAGDLQAVLDPTWNVGPGLLNGGYLMAVGVRAALAAGPHPDPLAVSATFLRPLPPGPTPVAVTPLRVGRTVASFRVTLGDPAGVDLQVTTATLQAGPPSWNDLPPAPIAAPEQGLAMAVVGDPAPGLTEVLEYAFDPATSGFLRGAPTREPELNLWLRLRDGRDPDPLALVLMADACPPVAFATGRLGWVPTVSMQVLVRARPVPGWCQVQARSRLVGAGFCDEEASLWDSSGALVAQARQIAVPARG